jgi:hypothetical protein
MYHGQACTRSTSFFVVFQMCLWFAHSEALTIQWGLDLHLHVLIQIHQQRVRGGCPRIWHVMSNTKPCVYRYTWLSLLRVIVTACTNLAGDKPAKATSWHARVTKALFANLGPMYHGQACTSTSFFICTVIVGMVQQFLRRFNQPVVSRTFVDMKFIHTQHVRGGFPRD